MSDDPLSWTRDGYEVSTDPARIDRRAVHAFLKTTYWRRGADFERVSRAIDHALCFGLYDLEAGAQIGFARLVTDRATFAYLSDVYVLPERQGHGLGAFLMDCVMAHPALEGIAKVMLHTADAHDFYRRYGFAEPEAPERIMALKR